MRLLVHEFICGGGMWSVGSAPEGSLLIQGAAMLHAVAEDLAAIGDNVVTVLRDARIPSRRLPWSARIVERVVSSAREERETFEQAAVGADGVLIIAPETSGRLLERCRWAEALGVPLISPGTPFIDIAADKHRTAERLREAGVPTTCGILWRPGESWPPEVCLPKIVKPVDGCGSEGVAWVRQSEDWSAVAPEHPCRIEAPVAGSPTSVAVLCGPAGNFAMPACRQHLSSDGSLEYLGGSLPLPQNENRRAQAVALAAARALPPTQGYIGIDLILGPAEDGSEDVVIEVNPRLTTSYVGLRHAACGNLAEWMYRIARGRPAEPVFADKPLEFTADGHWYCDD